MTAFPMLAVSFFASLVGAVFIICSVVLVLIVLIQKGKGGGLSAAFGGGMASGVLGSKTGDFLTWITIAMAGVFLALAVLMAKIYRPSVSGFGAGQAQPTQEAPAEQSPASQAPIQQQQPQGSEPPAAPEQSGGENTEAPGQ